MKRISFPPSFLYGAATSAYQIEGSTSEDGKGLSIWDTYSRYSGRTHHQQTGDVACDHYHKLDEDLDLMAGLGLQAYRFSLAWTRILPDGQGAPNEKGLAFYDRLIDGLRERNIQPWVTLFHWDYPYDLYLQGAWLNPRSPDWFARYTEVVARRFGDRVTNWMTLNEPQIFVSHGHSENAPINYAPGLKMGDHDLVKMAHNVLLAHGRSVLALREHCVSPPVVGWAQATNAAIPADEQDTELVDHAYAEQFSMLHMPNQWAMQWSWWNDAALRGSYPEDGLAYLGHHLPEGWERDITTINQPLDFIGLNLYSGLNVYARDEQGGIAATPATGLGLGFPETHYNWPVVPKALYWGPAHFQRRYQRPIVITENGMAGHDWVHLDGHCHDQHRIDFTERYLAELSRAVADGVEVPAYFHWCLMDNFEWGDAYKYRFGLVHVDFDDPARKRTFKDSAYWYRDLIAEHRKHERN